MFCFEFQHFTIWGIASYGFNKFDLCDCSYRPHLPVSYIKDILGFESDTQCTAFLKEMDVIFSDNEMTKIDCKASSAKLPTATVRPTQWSTQHRSSNGEESIQKNIKKRATKITKWN